MSDNKDETLRQFCDVTGADEARSRFFLESSNWQLEVALSSFYEHGGNMDDAPAANPATTASASLPMLSDSDMDSQPGSPQRPQKKDKKKPLNPKFGTIESLQADSSSDEEEDVKIEVEKLRAEVERLLIENCKLRREIRRLNGSTDEESGQAFYAGGSERSGQQILGPGKSRKDLVSEMFKSARERGAIVFEDEPSTASRGRGGLFGGTGYRLGQTADENETVSAANPEPHQEQPRSVRLRLYREGFSVDSGALRPYTDPENAEFLNCIRRGEIPVELANPGGEVRVSLEDKRHEECPRHISKPSPFTGKGQMLGSPTPATVGGTGTGSGVGAGAGAAAPDAADRAANQRAAQDAVTLDQAMPLTTVQIRLADGSRITGRFNHTHTVGDLRQYVSRAEPAYQLQPFALLTTFPSVELSDPTATLAQANLLNTTLLQRMK